MKQFFFILVTALKSPVQKEIYQFFIPKRGFEDLIFKKDYKISSSKKNSQYLKIRKNGYYLVAVPKSFCVLKKQMNLIVEKEIISTMWSFIQ